MHTTRELAERAAAHACEYLERVSERPVRPLLGASELRTLLGGQLPARGDDASEVIDRLAEAGRGGTVASQGPRYFGFVTGGSLPAAMAADWLVSAWDQNAQMFVMSPLAAIVEEIAADWLKQLFRLPPSWSVGFVTGAQMATFTGLVAARHHLLRKVGWDVERHGLFGAPPVTVIVSDEAHRTVFTALRMIGFGADRVIRVPTDEHGRMKVDRLAENLTASQSPAIVCAQVGNVNTGAADPIREIAAVTKERGAWLHVDGAFGMWAAVSSSRRALVDGTDGADSIATDGHKWLNVPYDSGLVFTAHPDDHRDALLMPVHYIQTTEGERDPRAYTPDESRRARGLPIYAALRTLGSEGVSELVDRCCDLALRFAERLRHHHAVRILNDIALNQVLVQFRPPDGDDQAAAALTQRVIAQVQQEGTCWVGGTRWHGQAAMRISVSNWSTTEADIDRSADAMLSILASELQSQ